MSLGLGGILGAIIGALALYPSSALGGALLGGWLCLWSLNAA